MADAPVQRPTFADVESIDVPDDETIVIKTGVPAAYFLNTIVVPYHRAIIAAEQLDNWTGDGCRIQSVPAPTCSNDLSDQAGYSVVRNPNYWKKDKHGTQLPYFDRIVYDWIASPVDADAAFRTGQLDHRWPANFNAWQDIVQSPIRTS
ncbi:MAG: hypothetical protein U5Q44_07840 [Dehalococcoidia bacterium]|nr:hypothetical protein [Dehalococcoidia bacterium]